MMTIPPEISDFANRAREQIGRYRIDEFILNPQFMTRDDYVMPVLSWQSIQYGVPEEITKIPADKRGIYAFVAQSPSNVLPPHGYVMYIGIAGKDSNRSLRERYRDYLSMRNPHKRPRISMMIDNWRDVLRFYYVSVEDDVSSEELKTIEEQLNSALLPPFSQRDVEAEIRVMMRAF